MSGIVGWLMAEAWPYIAGVAGALGVWLLARRSGKQEGRQEARIDQLEADASARESAREAAAEIERLDDAAVRDRARERMRNARER